MNLKPMSKMEVMTRGELLVIAKLVQMVTHHQEYEKITPEVWKEYVISSMGMSEVAADHILNKVRRISNRILADAT